MSTKNKLITHARPSSLPAADTAPKAIGSQNAAPIWKQADEQLEALWQKSDERCGLTGGRRDYNYARTLFFKAHREGVEDALHDVILLARETAAAETVKYSVKLQSVGNPDPERYMFVCPSCHCSNHVGSAGVHKCWSCLKQVGTEFDPNERYGLYAYAVEVKAITGGVK